MCAIHITAGLTKEQQHKISRLLLLGAFRLSLCFFPIIAFSCFFFYSANSFANQFEVAHIREQGHDMVIFPLDSQIQHKSQKQQQEIMYALQRCAASARLRGDALLVWGDDQGRMHYLAPKNWHTFLNSINMIWVAQRVNKKLTCH